MAAFKYFFTILPSNPVTYCMVKLSKTSSQVALPLFAGIITTVLCVLLALIRPTFHDEASTYYFAGSTLSYLFEMLQQDVHPPLYFLVAWGWMNLPVDPLFGLRILSTLFMGASVFVFIRAVKTWIRSYPSRLAAIAIATSPFLIFCGYFGRYYAMASFLWVLCFWALGIASRKPGSKNCALVGLLGALLFLTNYAAALIACVALLPFTYTLVTHRLWKSLAALALPGVVSFAAWWPCLQVQLAADLPGRWESESLVSATRLLKNAGFLAWTLAVSDGLPPWSIPGLFLAPIMILFVIVAVYVGLFSGKNMDSPAGDPTRHLTVLSLLILCGGVAVGIVFLPGPMYSFLPPRVALCGFAWLTLLVVIPDCAFRYRKPAITAVILAHLAAVTSMVCFRQTTNWAYEVPAKEIVAATLETAGRHKGSDAVFLPFKSMGNIRYELEQEMAAGEEKDILFQPKAVADLSIVTQIMIIRHSRSQDWPPSATVSDPAIADPPGSWTRTASVPFLKEDPTAQKLKALFSSDKIHPDKIRLETWQRQ